MMAEASSKQNLRQSAWVSPAEAELTVIHPVLSSQALFHEPMAGQTPCQTED